MRQATLLRYDGAYDTIDTYDINDFPFHSLNKKAMKCRKKGMEYIYDFATFDIESTTIDDGVHTPYGYMYIWQMDIAGYVITGRRWEEWAELMEKLVALYELDNNRRFVIYIHNESFEFQFFRGILDHYLKWKYEVFASDKRKPIRVTCENGIEFRCSYKLTNMSLSKATRNERGVIHVKADDDLDYRQLRTADTWLNDTEFGYTVSDVVSLYELIERRMINEGDNLETIPMTSTSYVRRDCRRACRNTPKYRDFFTSLELTPEVYTLLKEAARGGDTHANRYLSGRVWHFCDSYDAVSDYPAQLLIRDFPMSKFTPYGDVEDIDELETLCNKYACLFRVILTGCRLKDYIAMPYISESKATARSKILQMDNGRVLSTIDGEDHGFIGLTITDIDYKIIRDTYDYDEIYISDMHIAEYGKLPKPIRLTVLEYYKQKTELKDKIKHCTSDAEEKELKYYYNKSKNRLNGIFGMMYTDPVRLKVYIDEDGNWAQEEPDIEEALKKFWRSRNSFLYYAWGCWTTCHARALLQRLYNAMGQDHVIYSDTDSGKGVDVNAEAIEELNKELIAEAEANGAYYDYNGTRYYMGFFEKENSEPIKEFKTLGAKKYVYTDEKGLHVTISGVNKEKGAKELGSIDNFRPGFIFRDAGGLTLFYNDEPELKYIEIDGCRMLTGSNIGMIDSTYEIGLTREYSELIDYNIYYDIDKSIYL